VLAYLDPHATVAGIESFAPAPTPPINLLFQVYHLMFLLGSLFVPIGLLAGLLYVWGRRLWTTRWVLWILVITVFLTEIAIT
ncbi:cytochrome ubiquinol oxidase subunit I, partial [Klebsiella pneumoniae]|nr:cytochrome ubiquinol oxidase subunit I [Klebsiella pneumoniae]